MKTLLVLPLLLGFAAGLPAADAPADPAEKSQQLTSPDQVPEGLAKSDWSSIRAAYEAGRHAFQPIEGGWQARNPGQQWTTRFDGRGFIAEPRGGGWQWGLELKSYGFPSNEKTIAGSPAVKAEGQRLSYDWDATVQEWWKNDPRGLEHGFTVRTRPPSNSQPSTLHSLSSEAFLTSKASAAEVAKEDPLSFTLSVRGGLRPEITADSQGVDFKDAQGTTVLTYAGLKVWDADGKPLPSRFVLPEFQPSTINSQPSTPSLLLLVNEHGARYPLTIDPVAQQAYLKPESLDVTRAGDQFGVSVAVSGDTVVVGAHLEDSAATGVNGSQQDEGASDAGAAYVFVRNAGVWTQQAYLKPAAVGTTQTGDNFGTSVAVAGDTVIVGADLEDSSTTGVNGTANESATNAGAAYVFTRSGTVWTQQAYLKPGTIGATQASDRFGTSVAVSGDTVVVGAQGEDSSTTGVNSTPNESASLAGAAYVFTRSGTAWTQQAYLKPALVGATQEFDQFGNSVAVSGDTLVVGALGENSSTTGVNSTPDESAGDAGAAYVFTRSGVTWSQQAYLKPGAVGATQAGDVFGFSVSVAGDTVVVGAPLEASGTTGVDSTPDEGAANSGAAYVFTRSGAAWTQQAYLKPAAVGSAQAGDRFGDAVAVSGDTVIAGAPLEDSSSQGVNGTPDESAANSGAAYVFTRSGAAWTQQAYLKTATVGATQTGDQFGNTVAISGDTVVAGAALEDSNFPGVNGAPNESAADSGAACVFARSGTTWAQQAYLKPAAVGTPHTGDRGIL